MDHFVVLDAPQEEHISKLVSKIDINPSTLHHEPNTDGHNPPTLDHDPLVF
jgi:hypothetical protein